MADENPTCERIIVTLKEHGFRMTPQRRQIVEIICASGGRISAGEIYEEIRTHDPQADISAVYRTLEQLEHLGFVTRLDPVEGREVYGTAISIGRGHRCEDHTGKQLDRLARMMEVTFALSSDVKLDSLLQKIVDSATDLTEAEFGGLLVLREDGSEYEFFKVSGPYNPRGFPTGAGILSIPYREGVPLMLDDIRTHPKAVGTPPGHPPVKAFIGVPLSFRGKALGSLFVGNGPDRGGFSQEDRDLLMAFAAQAAIAIENTRLYQQSRQLTRLEERKRIAQSLHETVAQYLFTIGLEAEKCREQHGPCEETLSLIQRLADKANDEIRSAVFTLSMDTSLTKESLSTILTELVEEFENVSGVRALLILPKSLPRVPFRVKEAVYRIVREALTNVRKHARASMVAVTVSYESGRLSAAVQDDGTGFRLKDDGTVHFGLLTMEQLASNAGGEITISNNEDVGTVVRVSFPVENAGQEKVDGTPGKSADCR